MENQKKSTLSAKGPLITPSASPAPSRSFPPRLKDGRSPTKRSRLTATPSRPSESITTPPAISFAAQTYHTDTNNDLHNARQASSTRILSIWSQLADRYSRPLAEDDIVDLRKEDIIKDRNVLRSAPRDYEMGCFADLYSGGTDTPTDEGEGEGDSDDELDAFAPGADISDELELERANREKATAIREMDPADAEDLREFLEAESRWREEFGGEEEVEEEDEEGEEEEQSLGEEEGIEDESVGDVGGPEFEYESDEKDDLPVDKGDQGHFNHDDEDVGSSSDDELAIWDDHDEGSTVYAIAGDLDSNDHDGVVEIPLPDSTSSPPASSPSPPRKRRGRPRKTPRPQTPPRLKSTLNMSPPVVQLHTPPQSSSSVTGNTPDTFARTLPLSTSSPPRTKSKLASKAKLMPESDTNSSSSKEIARAKHLPKSKAKETPLARPTGSKWVPEVVIPRKASFNNSQKTRNAPRSTSYSRSEVIELSDDDDSTSHRRQTPAKTKGKAKAKDSLSPDPGWSMAAARETESDDPIALASSPELPPRSSTRQLSASDSERFYTPLPSTPRKRKRVVSASASVESEREEDEDDPGPSLPLISPEIDLIDFSKHRYDPYEQGQASPLPRSSPRRKPRRSSTHLRGDSDDEQNASLRRSSSQGHTRPHSNSNTQHYPYSETYSGHHPHNSNHNRHANSVPPPQYSVPQMQGPQAQFLLAQAMHHLSYLMNASGHAHPNVAHPSWPLPPTAGPGPPSSYVLPTSHNSDWPLYGTPSYHRHRRRSDAFDSSPIASSPASAFTTPVHQHPHPYTFNPSMSNATLPPSSPDQPSSPPSSPSQNYPSVRERSKSRGRRVSFRIDDDRPHGLSDRERSLRFDNHDNLVQDDIDPPASSSPSKYAQAASSKRGRSKSIRRELSSEPAVKTSPPQMRSKGKSKAVIMDDAESDGSPSRASAKTRSRRFERGQTPGPPSATPASRSRSILRHEKGGYS